MKHIPQFVHDWKKNDFDNFDDSTEYSNLDLKHEEIRLNKLKNMLMEISTEMSMQAKKYREKIKLIEEVYKLLPRKISAPPVSPPKKRLLIPQNLTNNIDKKPLISKIPMISQRSYDPILDYEEDFIDNNDNQNLNNKRTFNSSTNSFNNSNENIPPNLHFKNSDFLPSNESQEDFNAHFHENNSNPTSRSQSPNMNSFYQNYNLMGGDSNPSNKDIIFHDTHFIPNQFADLHFFEEVDDMIDSSHNSINFPSYPTLVSYNQNSISNLVNNTDVQKTINKWLTKINRSLSASIDNKNETLDFDLSKQFWSGSVSVWLTERCNERINENEFRITNVENLIK